MAIIGGGCAGLAAAWELSTPGENGKPQYDITVYEQSWRLGGKGASGRDRYGRIREHGIHIWLGFYENAFRIMRECYKIAETENWGPHRTEPDAVLPYGRFDDAFFPEAHVGVASKDRIGEVWKVWSGLLPPMEGLPGTPLDSKTNPFTAQGYLTRALEMTKALMHSIVAFPDGRVDASRSGRSSLDDRLDLNFSLDPSDSPAVIVERLAGFVRGGALTTAAGVMQGITILQSFLHERTPAPQVTEGIFKAVEALLDQARKQLRDVLGVDPQLRRKTEVLDLVMTIAIGLFRDRVLLDPRGLDAINHIDCKEWLLRHGAVKGSVDSPFVTGLYDLAFCYRDGDRLRPALAAGQALRGALRMFFSYRGAIFWRMRGGMGETVFSPLFRALRSRGVKFRFRHSLKAAKVEMEGTEPRITELGFQAPQDASGLDESPLDHFGCWPHDPPPDGNTARKTLRDGEDFDAVILAMGIDDFNAVCGDSLGPTSPRWGRMRTHVKTAATQAAQVWMTSDLHSLGWERGPVLVSAMESPFETWADMTHTLASERAWRAHVNCPAPAKKAGAGVKSVAYFCGVLPENQIRERDRAAVEKDVATALEGVIRNRMPMFWPSSTAPPEDRLATEDGREHGTFADQHVQANFEGSERFTLALPGSLEERISPLERLVSNMTIAGDWTECGFNEGCIEAAVMSGMLAAHAISGKPDLDDIIGYNHP